MVDQNLQPDTELVGSKVDLEQGENRLESLTH